MTYTYKKFTEHRGSTQAKISENYILRKEDNAVIPFDEANRDYQEYLEWVAEGNTAEEAD
tara:strand:- start:3 stop:182 length:180 start_codon:yes stop_codon:yes gene_type:complete